MKKCKVIMFVIIMIFAFCSCNNTDENKVDSEVFSSKMSDSSYQSKISSTDLVTFESKEKSTEINSFKSSVSTSTEDKKTVKNQTSNLQSTSENTNSTVSDNNTDKLKNPIVNSSQNTTSFTSTPIDIPVEKPIDIEDDKNTDTSKSSEPYKTYDIDYFFNYAINYGKSQGLIYDSTVNKDTGSWDTPIIISIPSTEKERQYREEDIRGRILRIRREDCTAFWVQSEERNENRCNLYIGY